MLAAKNFDTLTETGDVKPANPFVSQSANNNFFYLSQQWMTYYTMQVMIRAHSFPRKILPNSTGQLAKFHSSQQQNCPNSAACHGLPLLTENWESCSETSVIEGWHLLLSYVCKQHNKILLSQNCNETHDSWREST